MNTEREGGIEVHPTHPTHILQVVARTSNTSRPVHRGLVDSALGGSLELDVSVLSPALPPGVPHQPVVESPPVQSYMIVIVVQCNVLQWAELSTVSHQLYPVVDGDVLLEAATIEHSPLSLYLIYIIHTDIYYTW